MYNIKRKYVSAERLSPCLDPLFANITVHFIRARSNLSIKQ